MQDFEKLGAFYLGRPFDLATRTARDGVLLYDSRDLVTHAVCVGMTGSGKTGLCLSLLEEAAIDGIPAIAIDPKGDIANLLLTFPSLQAEEFAPWINADDARRAGTTPEAFAGAQAAAWRDGLAAWGQDGARIARLRSACDFAIYTPGSQAGIPLSVLATLGAPTGEAASDPEALRDRIVATASSLLGLLGLDADPVRSRDHILLSTILQNAWTRGESLDLGALISQIQSPPVARIGVMDLEAFYPAKERFALAMSINNLLASPGFAAWMEGEPLDIGRMLYTPEGRPRISIVSIAHLSDAERMLVVSLLLSQMVGWMRQQTGTTSLRAILYMDEIFGYFPPVANPPSKQPLLTLLKQGRAFGVGAVLATQNPVDLDYKGLSNAGTWFLGRLQTERDKARVLEGLEGAASTAGQPFDRAAMEQTLASLGSRVFLMNNVREKAPVVFETRWTLCYLRGPLGRQEIKRLMDPYKASRPRPAPEADAAPPAPAIVPQQAPVSAPAPAQPAPPSTAASSLPIVPPGIEQYFVAAVGTPPAGRRLVYHPMLIGVADVRFAEKKPPVDITETVAVLAPILDSPVPVEWSASIPCPVSPRDLQREGAPGAGFAPLPPAGTKAKSYETWRKGFSAWVHGSRKLLLLSAPEAGLVSAPGESEAHFRVRLQHAAREQRDRAVEALRQKYAPRFVKLQDKLARAQSARDTQAAQASTQQAQTAISLGATMLGALVGRTASLGTLGRATTAARGASRSMKEAKDVQRAEQTMAAVQQQMAELDAQARAEMAGVEAAMAAGPLETLTIAPKKTGILVQLVALTWVPYWEQPG